MGEVDVSRQRGLSQWNSFIAVPPFSANTSVRSVAVGTREERPARLRLTGRQRSSYPPGRTLEAPPYGSVDVCAVIRHYRRKRGVQLPPSPTDSSDTATLVKSPSQSRTSVSSPLLTRAGSEASRAVAVRVGRRVPLRRKSSFGSAFQAKLFVPLGRSGATWSNCRVSAFGRPP
jgi:hypothetical protein